MILVEGCHQGIIEKGNGGMSNYARPELKISGKELYGCMKANIFQAKYKEMRGGSRLLYCTVLYLTKN